MKVKYTEPFVHKLTIASLHNGHISATTLQWMTFYSNLTMVNILPCFTTHMYLWKLAATLEKTIRGFLLMTKDVHVANIHF